VIMNCRRNTAALVSRHLLKAMFSSHMMNAHQALPENVNIKITVLTDLMNYPTM